MNDDIGSGSYTPDTEAMYDDDNWTTAGSQTTGTAASEVTTCDLSTGFVTNPVFVSQTGWGYLNEMEKYVNYRIKYTAGDSLLTQDTGKIAYDYFTVRYKSECADLTVTIGANDGMPDVTYLASTAATMTTYTPTFTVTNDKTDNSAPACTLTHTYGIRREGTSTWYLLTDVAGTTGNDDFSAFMGHTGTGLINQGITIDIDNNAGTALVSLWNPAIVYEVKVTYSAAATVALAASATDYFMLTIKDKCIDNVITCDMAAIDFTHTINADLSALISPVASSGCT